MNETIEISLKDINLELNDGYIIDKPGTYIIAENLNLSIIYRYSYIITIASDNVIIDGQK